MTSPTASVIIRCFNEEEHIGRLLSGITAQTMADDIEIIVVDSGSTDATVSIASQFPTTIVSITPEEFSFGRALNIGAAEASGEFLIAASAHVYPVYTDWIERLLAPFADPEVALSYGKQRGNDVTKYSEHQVFAQWFPETSDFDQQHPFCNNANAAVRRQLWKKMPYDESLTGLEDLDWAKRALNRGYKIAYAADAPIIHVHDEAPSHIRNRYRREAIAMKDILPQESFDAQDFLRFFVSNALSDLYHAWHDSVLLKEFTSILTFRLMQFWGTYMGFSQDGPVSDSLRQRFYYPKEISRSSRERSSKPAQQRIDYDDASHANTESSPQPPESSVEFS